MIGFRAPSEIADGSRARCPGAIDRRQTLKDVAHCSGPFNPRYGRYLLLRTVGWFLAQEFVDVLRLRLGDNDNLCVSAITAAPVDSAEALHHAFPCDKVADHVIGIEV